MSENTNERPDGTQGNRRGPTGYLCCKHCKEDSIHDVPDDGHEGPCSTCDDPGALLRERVEAAEVRGDQWKDAAIKAEAKLAQAWLEGHAAGRDYQGDGWNSDAHDPNEDNPYRE